MHSKPENASSIEPTTQGLPQATICSQPWWRGVGYSVVSPVVLPENPSKSTSLEMHEGTVGTKSGQSPADDGKDARADVSKDMQNSKMQSDGSYGHEHQQLLHATSTIPPVMTEYACASFPFSDPYYGGVMTAYGTQALVHPHIIGMHHPRMPLPLEMTEEPVYVNAKQYHGILRRRQSRAKAELEKKLIKVRKPYLHESRHQHAMRRARGNGGRFLNTKKLDSNATKPSPEDTGSVASVPLQSGSSGSESLGSFSAKQEVKGPTVQGAHEQHAYTNGNGCYQQRSGFPMSAFHPLSNERRDEGDCLGQQRSGMLVGQTPHRAVTIQ